MRVVAAFLNLDAEGHVLNEVLPEQNAPYSLAELDEAGRTIGLNTYLVKWSAKTTARFNCPAVLYIRGSRLSPSADHFIACLGESGDKLCVVDFPRKPQLVDRERVFTRWDGEVLYLETKAGMAIPRLRRELLWVQIGFVLRWGLGVICSGTILVWIVKNHSWTSRAHHSRILNRLAFGAAICLFAFGIAFLLNRRPGTPKPNATLIAEPPLHQVGGGDTANPVQMIAFSLRNSTISPIEIIEVSSGCTCLVVNDIKNEVVAPNGHLRLEVEVHVPEMGRGSQRLFVHHTGSDFPLELKVEIEGKQPLPVIVKQVNSSPVFVDLSTATETHLVSIHTLEDINKAPWINIVLCESVAVRTSLQNIETKPISNARTLQRKYDFLITWNHLPIGPEFEAPLILKTNYGSTSELRLGRVSARLSNQRPFSPTVAVLLPGMRDCESIIFDKSTDSEGWNIDASAVMPEWLVVSWEQADGDRRLMLRLMDEIPNKSKQDFWLPIVHSDGRSASIEVVLNRG